jgi:hypothetical protein
MIAALIFVFVFSLYICIAALKYSYHWDRRNKLEENMKEYDSKEKK